MANALHRSLRQRLGYSTKKLGKAARRARERKKVTATALAFEVGIDLAQISRLENGAIDDPRLSTLWGIANALGVPLDELIGRKVP